MKSEKSVTLLIYLFFLEVYQCDGQRRKSRSWARRARLKGIVDTGATLHLLKD
eukprot:COSAG01_NODE_38187_length_493_cov_0.616751_1_plen_52_part_10